MCREIRGKEEVGDNEYLMKTNFCRYDDGCRRVARSHTASPYPNSNASQLMLGVRQDGKVVERRARAVDGVEGYSAEERAPLSADAAHLATTLREDEGLFFFFLSFFSFFSFIHCAV
jgi:hypothetical protein